MPKRPERPLKHVYVPYHRLAPDPVTKAKPVAPMADSQALAEIAEEDKMMADVLKVGNAGCLEHLCLRKGCSATKSACMTAAASVSMPLIQILSWPQCQGNRRPT